jgi:hypothetical protein
MFPSLEIAAAMAHPDGILTLPSISMSYSPSFRQKQIKKAKASPAHSKTTPVRR